MYLIIITGQIFCTSKHIFLTHSHVPHCLCPTEQKADVKIQAIIHNILRLKTTGMPLRSILFKKLKAQPMEYCTTLKMKTQLLCDKMNGLCKLKCIGTHVL